MDGQVTSEFVRAATSGRRARAEALLAAHPDIADDPYVRLVRGDGWDGDVHAPGGPNGWAPLLYVTFSEFASADLARELLKRGADPNVTFKNKYGDMPALYGAAGVIYNAELTKLLLEAGANADDGESPYHATEARDPEILRLVLEHGGNPEPIVLAHALDDERLEHVKLLLAAGADPEELLPHAVRRGRGPEYLKLLIDHGADLEHGERTAYAHAVLRGQDTNVRFLELAGADTTVAPEDRAIAAIVRGERATPPARLDVDQQEVLILAALQKGRLELVIELFGPDFKGSVGGSPEGTLLQHVSWVGRPDLARTLLAAGAQVTTLDWAAHGSQGHHVPGRDYVNVAEQLVEAGAQIRPEHLEQADGPLAEWLAAQLPR